MGAQHEWLVDLFVVKRQLINENLYQKYFEILAQIYEAKNSSDTLNEKIKNLFNEFVKKENNLKQVVDNIYSNADDNIKKKLEKLTK